MALGNRGNSGPRPWSYRPWDAHEWRRLREAWVAASPVPRGATAVFWAVVADAMATGRSPVAVERRAVERGMRAKIAE